MHESNTRVSSNRPVQSVLFMGDWGSNKRSGLCGVQSVGSVQVKSASGDHSVLVLVMYDWCLLRVHMGIKTNPQSCLGTLGKGTCSWMHLQFMQSIAKNYCRMPQNVAYGVHATVIHDT